jgi:hypothetical protein
VGLSSSYGWLKDAWTATFPWQLPLSLAAITSGADAPVRNGLSQVGAVGLLTGVTTWLWVAWGAVQRRTPAHPFLMLAIAGACLPLLLMAAYSMLSQPMYAVGRVEAAAVVPLALAMGVVSTRLNLAAQVVLMAVTVAAAAVPLHHEISVDTRSQERAIARGLAQAMGRGDVLLVATVHRDTFAYYLERARPDVAVRGYPLWRETNAFVAPAQQPEGDDAPFVTKIAEQMRKTGSTHLWLLSQPGPHHQSLTLALAHWQAAGAQEVGYLGMTVQRYGPPSQ